MTIRQDLIEACQDDAQRAGERNRMLQEARRARRARRQRPAPAAPVRRLGHLLGRRATASPRHFPASPEQTGQGQVSAPFHRRVRHEPQHSPATSVTGMPSRTCSTARYLCSTTFNSRSIARVSRFLVDP